MILCIVVNGVGIWNDIHICMKYLQNRTSPEIVSATNHLLYSGMGQIQLLSASSPHSHIHTSSTRGFIVVVVDVVFVSPIFSISHNKHKFIYPYMSKYTQWVYISLALVCIAMYINAPTLCSSSALETSETNVLHFDWT